MLYVVSPFRLSRIRNENLIPGSGIVEEEPTPKLPVRGNAVSPSDGDPVQVLRNTRLVEEIAHGLGSAFNFVQCFSFSRNRLDCFGSAVQPSSPGLKYRGR